MQPYMGAAYLDTSSKKFQNRFLYGIYYHNIGFGGFINVVLLGIPRELSEEIPAQFDFVL